MEAWIR